MKIIGIHNTGVISSACLLIDGKIIHAVSEERITRQKYSKYFPINAIEECLRSKKLTMDDIDIFAIGWNPAINIGYRYRAGLSEWQQTAGERFFSNPNFILPEIIKERSINSTTQSFQLDDTSSKKIIYVSHHLAHISNAFFLSNFKNSGIFSCDGYGERATMCWAKADNKQIKILKELHFPHSIGQFYSTITEFLGFRPDLDEWKVMGASSYGDYKRYYKKLNSILDYDKKGNLILKLEYFNHFNFESKNMFSNEFIKLFGNQRKKNQKLRKQDFDLAAATQKILEEYIFTSLRWFKKEFKINNICLTGGVFMNSVLNGKIASSKLFKNVYIPFSPDDSGNALGAALYANNEFNKKYKHNLFIAPNPYTGDKFEDKLILETLIKYKQRFEKLNNKIKTATELLIDQKIIGWFQGRSEFGQRALGNRSIIADPRNKNMKNKINSSIKYREEFRPFAPAILNNFVKEFFEDYQDSDFMEKVLYFKKEKINLVPAVVHVDNSGRLQTVKKEINELFYELIYSFYKKTSVPIILNTSFNINNEPIVNTPYDAIRTFHTSGLDAIIIGNYIIHK